MTARNIIDQRIAYVKDKHGDHPIQNHTILHLNELKKDFEAFNVLDKEL